MIDVSGELHRSWLRRRGTGDPVVMIHGFGGDLNAWRTLVAAASLPRPVLAIDLPGHGRSPAGATTFEAIVEVVADALAQDGITAAHLVGHSLGGAVATGVAAAGRTTARSLFLIAPAGLGPDIDAAFLDGYCAADSEAALGPWMTMLVADPASMPQLFVEITAQTRAQPGIAQAQREIAQGVFPGGRQAFSIRPLLERSEAPCRIVFGAADRIIPAEHMTGLPAGIMLNTLEGVGHMPQIEAVNEIASLLAAHVGP